MRHILRIVIRIIAIILAIGLLVYGVTVLFQKMQVKERATNIVDAIKENAGDFHAGEITDTRQDKAAEEETMTVSSENVIESESHYESERDAETEVKE